LTRDPSQPGALRPLARFALVAATWALVALAQPGVLRPDGFGHLAFFAVGPWAWAASRPGPRAFLAEWAAHSLGLASVFWWMVAFFPAILAPMSIVPALYPALAGVLLRRASGRLPLALLAPAAWMLAEVVRWSLPVPLSFGWFRLGMLMHDTAWLVGSAAFTGTWGLTWALGALGGLAADVAERGGARRLALAAPLGLLPLAAAVLLDASADAAVRRQRFAPGPDVLVVQPAIEQSLKAARVDPFRDLYVPQVTRTLEALRETRPADGAHPDLVLWGETFLPGHVLDEGAREAFADGARPVAGGAPFDATARDLELDDDYAHALVAALFGRAAGPRAPRGGFRAEWPAAWRATFGAADGPEWADRVAAGEPLLPPGTSFLTGLEAWTPREGADGAPELRRLNAVALWSAAGERGPLASKVHLVPGGESVEPLRWVPFVVDAIRSIANNVPDFVGADEPAILTLETRGGDRRHRMGLSVCYDNAFDDVYTAPVRRGDVDLFVVASNEAWYGVTSEMDHMLAFTRIAAAASQRSIVRATNSGISAVVGPSGADVAVLERDGARKMVPGALRARVPVPAAPEATFFARTEPRQPLAWGLGAALVLALGAALGRRPGSTPAAGANSAPRP